ncbi:hypothetical protein ACFY8P_23875 [Streptomyces sp. NPDC012693]|uniref:hypothetical protein n=1 Tax=Streptomyces sp. NPDC012693 TaxID=3364844 RepID=UPI0036AF7435
MTSDGTDASSDAGKESETISRKILPGRRRGFEARPEQDRDAGGSRADGTLLVT